MKRRKFKRMIAIILTMCMLVSISIIGGAEASAAFYTVSEDGLWGYTLDNMWTQGDRFYGQEICTIWLYFGDETSITLPTEVDGYIPKSVHFGLNDTVKEVYVPKNYLLVDFSSDTTIETVTFDRDYEEGIVDLQYHGFPAFQDCTNLKKVVLPNLLYEDEVWTEIYNSITKESYWTYLNCKLPADLFYNCKKLEEVILPDNIDCIGGGAFENCKSLKSLTVPEGVVKIGQYAFDGCSSMEYLYLPETIEAWHDYGLPKGITVSCPANSNIGEYVVNDNWFTFINSETSEVNGDANGDGTLDITDASLIQKKLIKAIPYELSNGDTNNDGKINIWDATLLQRQLAKMD